MCYLFGEGQCRATLSGHRVDWREHEAENRCHVVFILQAKSCFICCTFYCCQLSCSTSPPKNAALITQLTRRNWHSYGWVADERNTNSRCMCSSAVSVGHRGQDMTSPCSGQALRPQLPPALRIVQVHLSTTLDENSL